MALFHPPAASMINSASRLSVIRLLCVSASIFQLTAPSGEAAHWPQFRGTNAAGVADGQHPPLQFGPGTNELYRVAIPGGASSPCIWGDKIFFTALEGESLTTLCLRRSDGEVLWRAPARAEKLEAYHPTEGSPAASTPACDGERLYVYFGSCGLVTYDLNGKELWRVRMEPAQHVGDFGTGTSPIVFKGVVYLNRDLLQGSHLLAVEAATGRTIWRQERPEFFSSYSTPVIWEQDEVTDVVVAGSQRLKAYDSGSGNPHWEVSGMPTAACTTPVVGAGMLFFAGWAPSTREALPPGFDQMISKMDRSGDGALQKDETSSEPMVSSLFTFWDLNLDGTISQDEWDSRLKTLSRSENVLVAIKPGAGDLTRSHIAWKRTRGLPYVPSPLFYRNRVYLVKDGGIVSCYDAVTGEPAYEQERLGPPGSYYSSPVAADGRMYLASVQGKITVLEAMGQPRILAQADLGERCLATPAIVDGSIYYRTANHLWAFGERGGRH